VKVLMYGQIACRSRLAFSGSRDRVEICAISRIEYIPALLNSSSPPDLAFLEKNAKDVARVIECIRSLSALPVVFFVEVNKEHWQDDGVVTVDGYIKDTSGAVEILARLSAICRRVNLINQKKLLQEDADDKSGSFKRA